MKFSFGSDGGDGTILIGDLYFEEISLPVHVGHTNVGASEDAASSNTEKENV